MNLLCGHTLLARNGRSDGCILGIKEKSVSLGRSGKLGKKSSGKKLEGQPAQKGGLVPPFLFLSTSCQLRFVLDKDKCKTHERKSWMSRLCPCEAEISSSCKHTPWVILAHSRLSLRYWFRSGQATGQWQGTSVWKKKVQLFRQELCCAPHPQGYNPGHGSYSWGQTHHFQMLWLCVCVSTCICCTKSGQGDFSRHRIIES